MPARRKRRRRSGSSALRGRQRRLDDQPLQPARGVEVVAGPDHPHGGRAGPAVVAVQVAAHGVDQAPVGDAGRARAARAAAGWRRCSRRDPSYHRLTRSLDCSSSPRAAERSPTATPSSRCHRSSTASAARRRPPTPATRLVISASGDGLGAALGEVAAEGVVETARRGRRTGRLVGRRRTAAAPCVAATHAEVDGARQVVDAVDVGVGERAAQRGAGAARPEQQADEQADRAADARCPRCAAGRPASRPAG